MTIAIAIDRQRTQVSSTKGTYQKVADHIHQRSDGADTRVLDYGAGLCEGTEVLANYGNLIVQAFEPNPKAGVTPYATHVDDIQGLYDYVVSNCVLNVIEDYQERAWVLRNMLSHLAVGGQAIIMVRSWAPIKANKTKVEYEDGYYMESSKTFQRGYAKGELLTFVSKEAQGVRESFSTIDMAFAMKTTNLGDIGIIVERVK